MRAQGSAAESLEGNPILSIYSKVLRRCGGDAYRGPRARGRRGTGIAASTPLPAYPATTTLNLGSPNCVTDDVIMNDPLDSTSPITDTAAVRRQPGRVQPGHPAGHVLLQYLDNNTNAWAPRSASGYADQPEHRGDLGLQRLGTTARPTGGAGSPAALAASGISHVHGALTTARTRSARRHRAVPDSRSTTARTTTADVTTVSYERQHLQQRERCAHHPAERGSTTSTALTLSPIASSLNIPERRQASARLRSRSRWSVAPAGISTAAPRYVLTGISASDPEIKATTPDGDVVFFTLSGISTTSGGVFYTNTDANPCVTAAPDPDADSDRHLDSAPAPVHGVVGEISSFADYSWSCLDNSNFTWAAGNPIQLWKCGASGGADQQFTLATVGGHGVLEAIAPAGKPQGPWCVTDNGAGARLTIEPCTGTGGPGHRQAGPVLRVR